MADRLRGKVVLVTGAASGTMVKQGGGSIVNLSSIYGLVGRSRELGNGLDPYLHSKGGVAQLSRDMAVHFARDRVRVNALCPAGFVDTPLTRKLTDDPESRSFLEDRHPMGWLGQPAEIAAAALLPCWWPPQPRGCILDVTVTK
jgi:glucose 1-dehydrogenase